MIHFFRFFVFSWTYLEKSGQSTAQSELQMINFFRFFVFSFFPGHIWKNMNNHLPKSSSRWPTFFVFSFFRFFLDIYLEKSEESSAQIELQMIHFFRFFVFSWTYIWKNMNNHLPKSDSRWPTFFVFSFFRFFLDKHLGKSEHSSAQIELQVILFLRSFFSYSHICKALGI